MKKRAKLKRVKVTSSRIKHSNKKVTKKKSHPLAVVLFAVVLIGVVYAGLMNIFDSLLTSPSISGNAVNVSPSLSSFSPGDMLFSFFIIAILFGIFIFFIYQVKLKKKRK